MRQTWLITGCSTGFGREIALSVLARGWNAVLSARTRADIADIAAIHGQFCLAPKLDVRDHRRIIVVVKQAEDFR
jgi:NADP-dependent 3-hydroxy acid dehydrogenase YdfG